MSLLQTTLSNTQNILIVTSCLDVQQEYLHFFNRKSCSLKNYRIRTAASGFEALKLCSETTLDCLILDTQIADMCWQDVVECAQETAVAILLLTEAGEALPNTAFQNPENNVVVSTCRILCKEQLTPEFLQYAVDSAVETSQLARQLHQKNVLLKETQERLSQAEDTITLSDSRPEIADRIHSGRTLKESEAIFRLFVENSPITVAMFDSDMHYLVASNSWLADYHLSKDVIGKNHYDIFGDMPQHWKEAHQRGLKGEVVKCDEDCYTNPHTGQVEWLRWEVHPWWKRQDDCIGGIIIYSETITQRKQAESKIIESEARFRAAIQAVHGILWTNNAQGQMEGEQPGWASLTGQSYEEYQGYGWSDAVHPDDAQPTVDAWNEAVCQQKPFEFEHRVRRYDGVWRQFSIRAIPILNQDGSIQQWVGVHTDITERKAMELELQEAKEAAEEANRKKSQFLTNMSHELRTPLNSVIGYSEMMVRNMAGPLTEKQAKYVNNIATSGHHLLAMVNDILDLAKAEAGKIELKIEHIQLRPFVDQLLDLLNVNAQQKHVHIQCHIQPQLDGIHADPDRLRQIFFNLMSNAIKFNQDFGHVTVNVFKTADNQWVVSEIQDTGIGIAEGKLPMLFSEFYQVDSSISRQYEGTGLGLALTKRLVELHGGRITVESLEGSGSVFTFFLPANLRPEFDG